MLVARSGDVHASLAHLIHTLGPLGVGLGAGLEGETAVVLGGLLSRHGAFSPVAAALAAWLGSFSADQFFFSLGRWQRDRALVARVCAKAAFARALTLIDRHPISFCLAFRFVYGLRVAGPVAIGVSHIPTRLFLLLNLLMAGIWATLFTWLGFRFGRQFEQLLRSILKPEHAALLLAAAAVLLLLWLAWRRRAAKPKMAAAGNG